MSVYVYVSVCLCVCLCVGSRVCSCLRLSLSSVVCILCVKKMSFDVVSGCVGVIVCLSALHFA